MGKYYELGELDQYLFGQGNHYEIYKKLGSHIVNDGKEAGVYFAVWAPNAKKVSVVGDFNNWTPGVNKMKRNETCCHKSQLNGTDALASALEKLIRDITGTEHSCTSSHLENRNGPSSQ